MSEMDQWLGDIDPSVAEGDDEFTSGTYRCRDDIRYIVVSRVLEVKYEFKNNYVQSLKNLI